MKIIENGGMIEMTPTEVLAHTWLQQLMTVDDKYMEYPEDVATLARLIKRRFGDVEFT